MIKCRWISGSCRDGGDGLGGGHAGGGDATGEELQLLFGGAASCRCDVPADGIEVGGRCESAQGGKVDGSAY